MKKQGEFSGSQSMQLYSSWIQKSESRRWKAKPVYLEDDELPGGFRIWSYKKLFKWSMPTTFLGSWSINAAWQPKQWPGGPLLLAPSASVAMKEQAHP